MKTTTGQIVISASVLVPLAHPGFVPVQPDELQPGMSDLGGSLLQTRHSGLEEVLVTAQKRAERLRDVPISITVLAAVQLDRSRYCTVRDEIGMGPLWVRPVTEGTDMKDTRPILRWLLRALSRIVRADFPTLVMITVLAAIGLVGYAMHLVFEIFMELLKRAQFV
jgi:hypothetical protein